MPKSFNSRDLMKLLSALLPFLLGFLSSKSKPTTSARTTAPPKAKQKKSAARRSTKTFPKPSRSVGSTIPPQDDTERLLGRSREQFEDPIPPLFKARQSDTMVTVVGRVVHLLADDNEGSRHQRWLMDTPGGITIKVSHNIDLADRVPVTEGDLVRVRGEYEWNDLGGLIHWTHYDPKGWHEDGWVEHEGKYYGNA